MEEGRRRVELAECVRSEDREDELDKHAASYTDRKSTLSTTELYYTCKYIYNAIIKGQPEQHKFVS